MPLSTIGANQIASNAVTNSKLASGAVTAGDLPSGSVLQVVSVNFDDALTYGSSDSSGAATGLVGGFSVIPSEIYVNITAKKANSKYLIQFDGNLSASNDSTYGDWIGGWGFVVDPAGGTSWTQIGHGTNATNSNNVKFFSSRAGPTGTGNDAYHSMQLSGNYLYTSSASLGATLRFAIEYFHYDNAGHETLRINNRSSPASGNQTYEGNMATTLSVTEIAG